MSAPFPLDTAADHRLQYVLRLADTSLILGQRLGEWVGHAPALEEDLGLANIALDLIGQARLLLTYAGEIEARGNGLSGGAARSEDDLAFLRGGEDFRNLTLVEQPNGDFVRTIVRQCLADAWQLGVYESLQQSTDRRLAEIAARAVRETQYHLRYSSGWVVRLGDGTAESHERVQRALNELWPYTQELFATDETDRAMHEAGVAPLPGDLAPRWSARVDEVLREATLVRPPDVPYHWYGRRGEHSEHLGYILAEMQYLYRAHPGASW